MELKLCLFEYRIEVILRLLIVPYGIETHLLRFHHHHRHLLIVPYGIETK